MSLIKITDDFLETFSLTLHPETRYLSSSFEGGSAIPTGSVRLSSKPSKCFKNMVEPSQAGENSYDPDSPGVPGFNEGDFSYEEDLKNVNNLVIEKKIAGESANVYDSMLKIMETVKSASQISRNTKRFDILRFDPPFTYKLNTSVKNCIRKVLMPFYSSRYDVSQFAYTNYNTLNFFTGSGIPSNSAIIYANLEPAAFEPRPFSPTGSFSWDFYINPRYSSKSGKEFHAGTIAHLTSSYAISLVTGTLRDGNDEPDGFRIMLQLSHSADISPSEISLNQKNNQRAHPEDLVFLSSDNTLRKNSWHHVCIKWGGPELNDGTGSIIIDDNTTNFAVTASSILPPSSVQASALVIGNYYSGYGDEARFFNDTKGTAEGVFPLLGGGSGIPDPINFDFPNPLNAEVHDLKLFDSYISDERVEKYRKSGLSEIESDLMFYLPPYFVQEVKPRNVFITPFQTEFKKTNNPFNVNYSFGVGGLDINLPNFLREFKNGYYPRLWNLTGSEITTTVLDITAMGFIYASGSTKKRNLSILPNDNGLFVPDYNLLNSGTINTNMEQFKSVHGGVDLSLISLDDMVPSSSAYTGLITVTARDIAAAQESQAQALEDNTEISDIVNEIAGVSPESLQGNVGPILTIYQRTRDSSSNEISMFDISNLYYGNRILPGTFYLNDPNLTGSSGQIKMTLRDNSRGGLYRADCKTPHATWANVGNVLYEEGVAVVKSPHISYFGQDKFEAAFKGEQNTHIMTVNVDANQRMFNSSSNPQYKVLSASSNISDLDSRFVYITGINLHDDNLNVIMRATLAQPVMKRERDEFLLRFKKDF